MNTFGKVVGKIMTYFGFLVSSAGMIGLVIGEKPIIQTVVKIVGKKGKQIITTQSINGPIDLYIGLLMYGIALIVVGAIMHELGEK